DRSLRTPVHTEEKFRDGYARKEHETLDDERKDNPDRRQNGEDGADDKQPTQDTVNLVSRTKVRREPATRECQTAYGRCQRTGDQRQRGSILQRLIARSGIENGLRRRTENPAGGDILDLTKDQRNSCRRCPFRHMRRKPRKQQLIDNRALRCQPNE